MARKKKLDPRKLKSEAANALRKGKSKEALEKYKALNSLEPREAQWPQKCAEVYRKLGDEKNELACLISASNLYSQGGFLLRAIAICKQILTIEPEHSETQATLAALYSTHHNETSQSPFSQEWNKDAESTLAKDDGTIDEIELTQTVNPADTPIPAMGPNEDLNVIPLGFTSDEIESIPDAEENFGDLLERGGMSSDLKPEETAAIETKPEVAKPPAEAPIEQEIEIEIEEEAEPEPELELEVEIEEEAEPELELEVEIEEEAEPELELEVEIEEPLAASNSDEDSFHGQRVLPKVPLFSALNEKALSSLINRVVLLELAEDEILFRQGDTGDALYVIVEGAVAAIADGTRFAVLEEDEFFGEIALVTEQPRNATIQALVDTKLLVIHRTVINSLIRDEPSVLRVVLKFLRSRLIHRLVKTNRLFRKIPRTERASLASRFSFVEIPEAAAIIEQGKNADAMYILLSGSAEVIRGDNGSSTTLATLHSGDLFGEVSLLTSRSAGASVIARSKCFALALPADRCGALLDSDERIRLYVQELAQERELQNANTLGGFAGAKVSVI